MSSNEDAKKAAHELVDAIKRFQDSVDLFDATAALALGVNHTDLRCLTALRDRGAMKARDVAAQLGLTRGATTTALDRLEAKNLLTRSADAEDGRGVVVELTDEGRKSVDAIWMPVRKKGAEHLRSYSVRELRFLRTFFERSVDLHVACTSALRGGSE